MQTSNSKLLFIAIPVVFLALYYQVFFADYAYLDEAHELWNNQDDSNFYMFHVQGRWITGVLSKFAFGSVSTIEQMKWIRIAALIGWLVTTLAWSGIFRKWIGYMKLPEELHLPAVLFMACSSTTVICIAWAACFQMPIGVLAGLLSGHLLYKSLYPQKGPIQISNITLLLSLALGVVSLFTYQTTFGIFLLPFLLHYLNRKMLKPDRTLIIGLIFYIVVYIVYYMIFKQSLKAYGVQAHERASLAVFNPVDKLNFFFSKPLQQAFGLNLLFSPRLIALQILCPLIGIICLWSLVRKNKGNQLLDAIGHVLVVVGLFAFIYLPMMIAAESFDSYRTLLALNISVFIFVCHCLLRILPKTFNRKIFIAIASAWLLFTGWYHYNIQFLQPVKAEYKALRSFAKANYSPATKKVDFISADRELFAHRFNMDIYRDEFGVPSTTRDWVHGPLFRQFVFEFTSDRKLADSIAVRSFEDEASYLRSKKDSNNQALLVDINKLPLE